jgi:hypothetical protein
LVVGPVLSKFLALGLARTDAFADFEPYTRERRGTLGDVVGMSRTEAIQILLGVDDNGHDDDVWYGTIGLAGPAANAAQMVMVTKGFCAIW